MRVLIVEDDADVLDTLQTFFKSIQDIDIEIEHAGSGDQALGMAIRGGYDLMILDLHLPGAGGLDILPVLRTSAPRAIIAVMSGYVDLVTEDEVDQLDTVIAKPFKLASITELVQLTNEILERRDQIRKLGVE